MAARSAAAAVQSSHFFKVFFPELSGQILSIPPAFGANLKSDAPGTAALRGPSGNIWRMDLAVVNSDTLCFCNGWKAFVADHSIVAGDFLIFRYDGKLQFTVLLFDATGCEKRCGFSALPCQEAVAAVEGCRREGLAGFVESLEQRIYLPAPKNKKKKKKKREKDDDLEAEAPPKKKKRDKDNYLEFQDSPEKKKKKKRRRRKKHSSLGEISTEGSRLDDDSTKKSQSGPNSSLQKKQPACCCATRERSISSPDCISGALGMMELSTISSNEPKQVPLLVEKGPKGEFVLLSTLKEKANRSPKLKFQSKQETLKMKSCSEKPEGTRPASRTYKVPPDYRTLVESSQACHRGEDMFEELRAGSLISQRRQVTEKEVDETLERARSFKSNNPWTTIVMRGGYVYAGFFLHIPALFAREHLPNETSMVTLWDSNGKSWIVKCFADARGARFSAGWGKFAYAHNLEQYDVCLFELIERCQMKVHIYRVVEEIAPLLRVSGRRG